MRSSGQELKLDKKLERRCFLKKIKSKGISHWNLPQDVVEPLSLVIFQ